MREELTTIQEALQAASAYLDDAASRKLTPEEAFDIQRTRGLIGGALRAAVRLEAEAIRSGRAARTG